MSVIYTHCTPARSAGHQTPAATTARLVRKTAMYVLAIFLSMPALARAEPENSIIADASEFPIRAGRFSFLARFQSELQQLLDQCHVSAPRVVPPGGQPTGTFDEDTAHGIQRALKCPPLNAKPELSGSDQGALTRVLWDAVMNGAPPPTLDERVSALILSFEATDFGGAPEWNFCQDSKLPPDGAAAVAAGRAQCVNHSDPCSLVTWGPRGATAGTGKEMQRILWLVAKRDPGLVARAFGTEYANMQRFLRLDGGAPHRCNGDSDVELFMCGVWLNLDRRQVWDNALISLGQTGVGRQSYHDVYSSSEYDGQLLKEYYDLWRSLDLSPTEVDYAFFLDRITQAGGPNGSPDDGDLRLKALRQCLDTESRIALTTNAAARRCVARLLPYRPQATERLARDVAFYMDGYRDNALTTPEVDAWGGYVPLAAEHNLGLSDERAAPLPAFRSLRTMAGDWPQAGSASLTDAERQGCPAAIVHSVQRRKAHTTD